MIYSTPQKLIHIMKSKEISILEVMMDQNTLRFSVRMHHFTYHHHKQHTKHINFNANLSFLTDVDLNL